MKMKILSLVASITLASAGGQTLAAGDAAMGQKVFKKCKACHSLKTGKNGVGPSLAGVIGRKAGSVAKFKYSKSMAAAGAKGLVWNDEALFKYLKNPSKFLKAYLDDKKAKGKMVFKVKKKGDRENVAAFLTGK